MCSIFPAKFTSLNKRFFFNISFSVLFLMTFKISFSSACSFPASTSIPPSPITSLSEKCPELLREYRSSLLQAAAGQNLQKEKGIQIVLPDYITGPVFIRTLPVNKISSLKGLLSLLHKWLHFSSRFFL